MDLVVAVDDPNRDDVAALLDTHLAFSIDVTPPGLVHAVGSDEMIVPEMIVLAARRGDRLMGIGALRELDRDHVELKSMHTVATARRQGVGRAIVEAALEVAMERGYRRVSLETGTYEVFAAARTLYERMGFVPCEPFGEHTANPFSLCMTIELGPDSPDD